MKGMLEEAQAHVLSMKEAGEKEGRDVVHLEELNAGLEAELVELRGREGLKEELVLVSGGGPVGGVGQEANGGVADRVEELRVRTGSVGAENARVGAVLRDVHMAMESVAMGEKGVEVDVGQQVEAMRLKLELEKLKVCGKGRIGADSIMC